MYNNIVRKSNTAAAWKGDEKMENVNIPVGTSDFTEIRQKNYYYVDKTGLIEELLRTSATKVTLITRPRRFGKTLGMSMMADFFDIRKDSSALFEGLSVSKNQELCRTWMNQYPTVFVSFRNVDGLDFSQAYARLYTLISELYKRFYFLMNSDLFNIWEKNSFGHIAAKTADSSEVEYSLLRLTQMLSVYYNKPVILLIDEYDVPLAKASAKGYYREMLSTIHGVMSVLKDNPSLGFAVVTGCLQIVKESIFTGTNNFVTDTISDSRLDEYFGFTQEDVDRLLFDTELSGHKDEIREWYNGYLFGKRSVYCPWDVMNHVRNLLLDSSAPPASYWEHTSHDGSKPAAQVSPVVAGAFSRPMQACPPSLCLRANDIIYQFISTTEADVNDEFETLLAGGYIIEPIEPHLTYDILHSSERNIWTLLYFTGYLTKMRPETSRKPRQTGIP